MKTKIRKIIAVATALVGIGMLSSYTIQAKKEAKLGTTVNLNDQQEVYNFIRENISIPISEKLKLKEVAPTDEKTKYFSRCPSGYTPRILTKHDSVKTNAFVSGKVFYYKGCEPIYICDFKVCVDKHFIVVRTKGEDYKSVSAWIAEKNKSSKTLAKN
jgi:hypothetical protein